MAEIERFSKLSKTTRWLICSTIDHLGVWPEDGSTPDFVVSIGGIEIGPTEFFCAIADLMDEDVERKSEEGALQRFDDLLGAFTDNVEDIHSEFKERVRAILRDAGESD